MALTSNTKRMSISFTPLRTSGAIEVVGSVPRRQTWSADTGEFTPDYTLTPLVLMPRCNATDPDRYVASGSVNAGLTNMKWYEIQGTQRTLIEAGNANYEITTEGENKGQIKVKRNSSVVTPLGLEFYAEYADPRGSGQVYVFRLSTVVPVSDATVPAPVLLIDSPATVVWNPLRQPSERTFAARVLAGDTGVTASSAVTWHRVLDDTGAEELITGEGDNDWEVVSVDGPQLTIDMDYIGDGMTYVCRATYDGRQCEGVVTTLVRRIPKVEVDWEGTPTAVPGGTTVISPRPIVRDTMGILADSVAAEWLRFLWLTKAEGASTFTQAAEGASPTIPFTDGMTLRLDVEDRGPMAVIVDDDGSYITDEDGSFLFQRENG